MGLAGIVLCCLAVVIANGEVSLEADRPYVRVALFDSITLSCCYKGQILDLFWVSHSQAANSSEKHVERHSDVRTRDYMVDGISCSDLTFTSVQLNDSGLYRCLLKDSKVYTHGTYMLVYEPLEKTINLSESTKNNILTAEGVLLLLCVLLPSASLLLKSKRLKELEKKKAKREDENIYQGLNLDDCCATYDQIERSQAHGPYQDVGNIMEEGGEFLEKP